MRTCVQACMSACVLGEMELRDLTEWIGWLMKPAPVPQCISNLSLDLPMTESESESEALPPNPICLRVSLIVS